MAAPLTNRRGSFLRGRRPIKDTRLARLERPAFHQRVAPTPQCRYVDVNPVVPPVNGFRRKIEEFLLSRRQSGGEEAGVLTLKDVLIMKDERLIELDELLRAHKIAFGFRKRRLAD